jgi:hypothetical protein
MAPPFMLTYLMAWDKRLILRNATNKGKSKGDNGYTTN